MMEAAGCTVCRSRKVRCDKSKPQCGNCMRLGIECPGYGVGLGAMPRSLMLESTRTIFRAAGIERRRTGACDECRLSKIRCTRSRPSCRRCTVRGTVCSYRFPGRSSSGGKGAVAAAAAEEEQGPSDASPSQHRTIEVGEKRDEMRLGLHSMESGFDGFFSDAPSQDANLRLRLVNAYFERVHPLRCLSFIHKPSFMRAWNQSSAAEEFGAPLLSVMYALGARVLYWDTIKSRSSARLPGETRNPGEKWVDEARKQVIVEAHNPTVQHIMTMILICEYALQVDQQSLVFFLCGCINRGLRLLDLDSSNKSTSSISTTDFLDREAGNRLVWACYCIDAMTSSGVDRNSFWSHDAPQISLPCSGQAFLTQAPPEKVYYLSSFEDLDDEPNLVAAVRDLDVDPLMIIMTRMRAQVLRLIRTPGDSSRVWEPTSDFMRTINHLDTIHNNLPEKLHLTDLNAYILKDQHLLGAVTFIHLLYHTCILDLTRVSLAGFAFPLATAFQHVPAQFRTQCQDRCRFHGSEISELIARYSVHGSVAFDDRFAAVAAVQSSMIQTIYSATVDRSPACLESTRRNMQTNLKFLGMSRTQEKPGSYMSMVLSVCAKFGLSDIAEAWRAHDDESSPDQAVELIGPPDIDYLGSLSSFRKARLEVQASRSTRSAGTVSSSSDTQSSPQTWISNPQHQPPPIVAHSTIDTASGQTPVSLKQSPPEGRMNSGGDNQDMPTTTTTTPSLSLDSTIQDYIRTADDMAGFLTWDLGELSENASSSPLIGLNWQDHFGL